MSGKVLSSAPDKMAGSNSARATLSVLSERLPEGRFRYVKSVRAALVKVQ